MLTEKEFNRLTVRGSRWEVKIPDTDIVYAVELMPDNPNYISISGMVREDHGSLQEAISYLYRHHNIIEALRNE